jgi:hypothetical protein
MITKLEAQAPMTCIIESMVSEHDSSISGNLTRIEATRRKLLRLERAKKGSELVKEREQKREIEAKPEPISTEG